MPVAELWGERKRDKKEERNRQREAGEEEREVHTLTQK